MRAASSGSLVPAMGLAEGEGAGDAARRADGAEGTGSGGEEAAEALAASGVLDARAVEAAEDTATAGTTEEPVKHFFMNA